MFDKLHRFHPRSLDLLKDYSRARFVADLGAGFTVGVVALPLALAFAIASGVKPEQGVFTAIIAGFLISALGGSSVQIGGPAGAFIVIIYGIQQRYGLGNLLIATILAGGLLLAMGALKLGVLVRYIPVSIVIGFTNGIAILIGLSQLKDFLGLQIDKMPADFFSQLAVLSEHWREVQPWAPLVGSACVLIVVLWPKTYAMDRAAQGFKPKLRRWMSQLPGTVIALAAATAATYLLHLPLDTIGSRFGGIPQGLPSFALPDFSWSSAQMLLIPTITIALLGAIESLLCARVADKLTELKRHDPNQELMAQGIANIVTPFFGGIPATGTIARTVTNVRAGANSPVAGMVHALCLLIIILVAAPLAAHIPLAALAGILLVVAWNMGDWHEFARLRHFSLPYRTILLGTFVLTVVFDLTVAVEVGLVLACVFFIYRMSTLFKVEPMELPYVAPAITRSSKVYQLYGSLFFGAVGKVENLASVLGVQHHTLVLDAQMLISMDSSGLDALQQLQSTLERQGQKLILCGLNEQPASLIQRGGLAEALGAKGIYPDLSDWLLSQMQITTPKPL
ncbi:SulP family inorganic anion transporter [Paucibacter sp. KCTC 42545]|uniref:SulP family inorganic anion transporter n=1 Tax=Paucibacter sp. KCTC 42545 TaxID=1768242 RepID=UPI000733C2B6|nr:SulP family inorganic anion transporter [Paucibacter sp. KCTC 42545]ALT76611.1 sulfate transporter [Paucibacter sp. KCTC 42545]